MRNFRQRLSASLALITLSSAAVWAASGSTLALSHAGVDGPAVTGAGGESPSISADGRYVAFASAATNWHVRANGQVQVYVRDRLSSATELITLGVDKQAGNSASRIPQISPDGRYVAFSSSATNLIKLKSLTPKISQLYVRDRFTGKTELVSSGPSGPADGHSGSASSISADNRFVAFTSSAVNLVPNDQNGQPDVFVRDRTAGTIERVSVSSTGVVGNGDSGQYGVDINEDGRFVAFGSNASNLVPADTNSNPDVFLRDRMLGTTERVSLTTEEAQAAGDSRTPSISADGRYVAFTTSAHDFDFFKVIVRDREEGVSEGVDEDWQGNPAGVGGSVSISANGRFVAFVGQSSLLEGGNPASRDVYLRDRLAETTFWISEPLNPQTAAGVPIINDLPVVSDDGQITVFSWTGDDLIADDTNGAADCYARDINLGSTQRVSVGTGDVEGVTPATASGGVISAEGRVVAFVSNATNLVPNDTNRARDAFTWNRVTGQIERVSVSSAGGQANGEWTLLPWLSISDEGRYVGFASEAPNLVEGDTNGRADYFVHDTVLGTTERVSLGASGQEIPLGIVLSHWPVLSADGRFVAFVTDSPLTPDEPAFSFSPDVFVRDRVLGTVERVTVPLGGGQLSGFLPIAPLEPLALSTGGRYVAFACSSNNLVSGDSNNQQDVFVRDLELDFTERVSVSSAGEQANHRSSWPSISDDGRCVAFGSNASNLGPADTTTANVFLRDRSLGTTEQVDTTPGGTGPNSFSSSPCVSPDGRFVAFRSSATDLVKKDTNGVSDLFLRDRQAGFTLRVNLAKKARQLFDGAAHSGRCVAADGRYVVFNSSAPELLPKKAIPSGTVFLRDRGTAK